MLENKKSLRTKQEVSAHGPAGPRTRRATALRSMRVRLTIMILGTALTGLGCSAPPEEVSEDWLGETTAALPASSWHGWNVVGAQNGSLAAPESIHQRRGHHDLGDLHRDRHGHFRDRT